MLKPVVEKMEELGQTIGPGTLGFFVGSAFVIGATYALLKIKGLPGGIFDGIKSGANCGFCRPFWIGVGLGIVGTVLVARGVSILLETSHE